MVLSAHHPGQSAETKDKDSEEERLSAEQISDISAPARTFEAQEWIRNLNPGQRTAIEAKLVRKIDLRLLPMIVLI